MDTRWQLANISFRTGCDVGAQGIQNEVHSMSSMNYQASQRLSLTNI